MKISPLLRNLRAASVSAALLLALGSCAHHSTVNVESAATAGTVGSGAVLIPRGTVFYGKLQTPINSKTTPDGTVFSLVQTDTFFHKNPALHGDILDGHLTYVKAAGPLHNAGMTIVFDDIRLADGTKAPVSVRLVSMKTFNPQTHICARLAWWRAGRLPATCLQNTAAKSTAV